MRARREVRAGHEGREPVAAHPPNQELRAEAGEEEASEERDVVGEDRTSELLQRRDEGGREQQVLGEGERVGKRVEVRAPGRGVQGADQTVSPT